MGFYGRKLIRRLMEEFGIKFPKDVTIRNCRPGWSTLSAGGFKWTFHSYENATLGGLGSQSTVRKCAMAQELSISRVCGDTFIDVERYQEDGKKND